MADEKNPWTTAFEETAREKKRMDLTDPDKPRSNEGRYNENEYHPNRKKRIALARRLGSTSAADMEKAAEIKRAARRAAYASAKKGLKAVPVIGTGLSLLDADELGAAETPLSEEQMSEMKQMEEYKKGGLVGRGQGRAIKIKTTKLY
jgi:hypothetical protein